MLKHPPDATPDEGKGGSKSRKASTTNAYGDYVFEVVTGDKRVVLATESSEKMAQIVETLHEIIKNVKFLDNQTMNPAMGLTVHADGKVAGGGGARRGGGAARRCDHGREEHARRRTGRDRRREVEPLGMEHDAA